MDEEEGKTRIKNRFDDRDEGDRDAVDIPSQKQHDDHRKQGCGQTDIAKQQHIR